MVSIIRQGIAALGWAGQFNANGRPLSARRERPQNRIVLLVGCRAAENLIFAGDVSSGAADDHYRATGLEIAREIVADHGIDAKIGQRMMRRYATEAYLR